MAPSYCLFSPRWFDHLSVFVDAHALPIMAKCSGVTGNLIWPMTSSHPVTGASVDLLPWSNFQNKSKGAPPWISDISRDCTLDLWLYAILSLEQLICFLVEASFRINWDKLLHGYEIFQEIALFQWIHVRGESWDPCQFCMATFPSRIHDLFHYSDICRYLSGFFKEGGIEIKRMVQIVWYQPDWQKRRRFPQKRRNWWL